MNYIEFSKEKLVNIEFSKARELLRCSRTGAYTSTTLVGLNTRKYHGFLIVPQDKIDQERHLLVSQLNETIIVDNLEFRLGINQYKGGVIDPKGNKYLQKFVAGPVPTYYFRVGKFNFTKEILFSSYTDRLIVKYTILDDYESASLLFQPLLAFRQIHQLTHANDHANTGFKKIENGVEYCLYENYTPVSIQCSDPVEYEHAPTWYYDFEYEEELKRGYDGHEDLINPGKISVKAQNKEIYLLIGTEPASPEEIKPLFEKELKNKTVRSCYLNCLQNAADQFIIKRNGKTEIIAGYPWFGRWGRDTFISLPGLTLSVGKPELCKEIMDSMISEMQHGLFPNIGSGEQTAYNSVDAPLWFFRTLQQYTAYTKQEKTIWKEYGSTMKSILGAYRNGSLYNIKMTDNGLIYAGAEGKALTWMDAIVHGVPVTPRTGYQVEINALWYNAIRFSMEMAKLAQDQEFINQWESIAEGFPAVFKDTFWSKEKGYLADFVNGDTKNFQVRPNMVIVTSLPYSPISEKIKQLILKKTIEELLTSRGIRTLSPNDPDYKGCYQGNQEERDSAYHQGTAWPWLLGPFAEGYLLIYQKAGVPFIEKLFYNFEEEMKNHGISTISEIYDGNPPHRANGCISQAWSVGALLYLKQLIDHYKK